MLFALVRPEVEWIVRRNSALTPSPPIAEATAMISDRELWACAQQMIKQHGGKADEAVAERVAELAKKGDAEGVATWRAIADRIDRLIDSSGAGGAPH